MSVQRLRKFGASFSGNSGVGLSSSAGFPIVSLRFSRSLATSLVELGRSLGLLSPAISIAGSSVLVSIFIALPPCVLLVVLSPVILQTASDSGPSPVGYLLLSPCRPYCAERSRAPRGNCSPHQGDPPKYLLPVAQNRRQGNRASASGPSPRCPRRRRPAMVRPRSALELSSKLRRNAPAPVASVSEYPGCALASHVRRARPPLSVVPQVSQPSADIQGRIFASKHPNAVAGNKELLPPRSQPR